MKHTVRNSIFQAMSDTIWILFILSFEFRNFFSNCIKIALNLGNCMMMIMNDDDDNDNDDDNDEDDENDDDDYNDVMIITMMITQASFSLNSGTFSLIA